ncbi:hypothetical protein AN958_10744 [Leucoagaricus sp. SymC.cos]|nr:hypothetical protein AN958_10744 [Leucoagaricus sp. SymC.cos]
MFSLVPFSVLFPIVSAVLAQESGSGSGSGYVAELVNQLNTLGYTEAASVLTRVNGTTSGQQWLSELPNGNYTAFLPNNTALQNLPGDVSGNDELLSHMSGQSSSTGSSSASATQSLFECGIFPNDTIGRTLLNSSNLVHLEGNKSQVLAWTRNDPNGNVTILNQAQNITVTNSTTYQNLFINTIDGVIAPPGNLTQALTATNATSFLGLAQQVNVTGPSGSNMTVLEALSNYTGFTLFVPTNDAIQTAQGSLSGLQNNQTAIMALLGNLVINGTTVYSPDIRKATASGSPANFTSAAGEPLIAITNDTGVFIQNTNGSSAQIVRPDVLLSNGVFHIIDNVLVQTDSDPAQASSAVLSASSVASAASSTDTLPIGGGFATLTSGGQSQTQSSSAQSSQSSSSSSSESSSSQSSSSSESSSSASASATLLSRVRRSNDGAKLATSPLTVTLLGALVWIFAL